MSRDLRLYSLSLVIVLMLWFAPARADYGLGSNCPALAIPIPLKDGDVWHARDDEDGGWQDYRDLYPDAGTEASVVNYDDDDIRSCVLLVDPGRYYDGANHMWVLDDNMECHFDEQIGDFKAGVDY